MATKIRLWNIVYIGWCESHLIFKKKKKKKKKKSIHNLFLFEEYYIPQLVQRNFKVRIKRKTYFLFILFFPPKLVQFLKL